MQKVLVMFVIGAMVYTALAPESQTTRLADVSFKGYNSWLKTITGQTGK